MSKEKSHNLRREVKNFIDETHSLMSKSDSDLSEEEFHNFADKIWSLNHYSNELLKEQDNDESIMYNARIIKDLTESPVYKSHTMNETCSLVSAADRLKKEKHLDSIRTIMMNLIRDQMASEVLLDDLMVIYKELAA